MSDTEFDEQGHADDIVSVSAYEASMPSSRIKEDFLPWHRPRKQFVRDRQWCTEVQSLIDRQLPREGVLKYLGLPGLDLLDVRHFHSIICERNALRLRFLGFNKSARSLGFAQTELNISMDEVKRLTHVDPLSEVIGDDFRQLANNNSMAFRKACELGPYDVVNLDLCDGFGAGEPGILAPSYYNAVNSLLSIQARSPNPWLLFLTTRADEQNINLDVLQALIDKYCANLAESQEFKNASQEYFSIENEAEVENAVTHPKGLLEIFVIGICKWLVTMGLQHKPHTIVNVLNVFGYRVKDEADHEDLISLALRFEPQFGPVADPFRLAAATSSAEQEGVLATKALRRVAKRVDADSKLREGDLFQRMTDATANLLGMARYDIPKYRAWVAAGCPVRG